MKEWDKRFLIQFWAGMIGYMILLPFSLISSTSAVEGAIRYLIAIAPAIPFFVAIHAVVKNIRSLDEFQRQVHFKSVVYALLLTGGITFTYGLLESNGLLPHLPAILISPMMIFFWGFAQIFVRRHYEQ